MHASLGQSESKYFWAILNNPKSSFGSRFISFNIFAKRVGSSYRKYSKALTSLFSAKNELDFPKMMTPRKLLNYALKVMMPRILRLTETYIVLDRETVELTVVTENI